MTEPNIWYVSATSQKGFTADIEHAIRDQKGNPVLADGNVKLLLGRQYRDFQRTLDVQEKAKEKIWETLLDTMESYFVNKEDGLDRFAAKHEAEIQGLLKAVAILQYGHDYRENPDETVNKVWTEAKVRYQQESEE